MGHTSNALLFQTCTHSRPPPRASAKYPLNKRSGASTSPECAAHVLGLRHGKLHPHGIQGAVCLVLALGNSNHSDRIFQLNSSFKLQHVCRCGWGRGTFHCAKVPVMRIYVMQDMSCMIDVVLL